MHTMQWWQSGRFQLYDYGSAAANKAHYGTSVPPDIAAGYSLLDMPVHLVAGARDGVISHVDVHRHYQAMKAAGCRVTYKVRSALYIANTWDISGTLS